MNDAFPGQGYYDPPRDMSPLVAWLADHHGESRPAIAFFSDLCQRLVAENIPLWRAMVNLVDQHPQIAARSMVWRADGAPEEREHPHNDVSTEAYLQSPVSVIHKGASGIRRRLDNKAALIDFPILRAFQDDGATDYVAMPLRFSDGSRHFVSWVTRQKGGFTTNQLERLYELLPLICLRLELDHSYLVRRQLLTTYLGRQSAERIIAGHIRRNQVDSLTAIILYCDLRSFTHMTETLTSAEVIKVLAEYYEAVAQPIQHYGGDIVKLMGDGLLSIFPLSDDVQKERRDQVACGAVAAARSALGRLSDISAEKLPAGVHPLRAGFALHVGKLAFGNVGSLERLDFTVIGPAVNEAVRLEELTKKVHYPLLTTEEFASLRCNVPLEPLGLHHLRDVDEAKHIFKVSEFA